MGFNCECLGHISVGSRNFPINFHEFLWFPMGRGIEKLKTHHFFTNLSSPHLFNIVAMVLELVVDDFRWFSMVRGIGKLKTHHLSTNLSSPDAAATTAAGAATMTATRGPRQSGPVFGWFSMYFNGFRGCEDFKHLRDDFPPELSRPDLFPMVAIVFQ